MFVTLVQYFFALKQIILILGLQYIGYIAEQPGNKHLNLKLSTCTFNVSNEIKIRCFCRIIRVK